MRVYQFRHLGIPKINRWIFAYSHLLVEQKHATLARMHCVCVGCVADEKYAPGLAGTLRSLADACSRPVQAWVIDGGLSPEARKKLNASWSNIEVHWLEPDFSHIKNLKAHKWFNYLVHARLLLPHLATGAERLLYVDSDMLVRGDVAQLYDSDLYGKAFGAVQDLGCLTVSEPTYGLLNWRELGLPPDRPYFNSGLLLMNIPRWNELALSERVLEYVAQNPEQLRWPGQDGVNVIGGEHWTQLDPAWNSLYEALRTMDWSDDRTDAATLSRFTVDPKIVHFIGPIKPWQASCAHPRTSEFLDVLRRTAFAADIPH